jgi:hypothetical protein
MSFLRALTTRLHADSDVGFITITPSHLTHNASESSRAFKKILPRHLFESILITNPP